MILKLIKLRKTHMKSLMLCPVGHEPIQWAGIGSTQEVPDQIGYELLAQYSDILEQVQAAPKVAKAKVVAAPANK